MLKRFMIWLLHRLQKVLSIFSGRRNGTRPTVSTQQETDRALSVRQTEPLSLSHFALPDPADAPSFSTGYEPDVSPQPGPDSVMHEIPLVFQNTPIEPAVSAEVSLLLMTADYSSVEIQDASQLPEIHDLLPATEPEEPAEWPPVELLPAEFSPAELSVETEPPLEKAEPPIEINEPVAADSPQPAKLPEQAILFSFEITESEVPDCEAAQPNRAETVSQPAASSDEMAYQAAEIKPQSSGSALSIADSSSLLAEPPAELSLPEGPLRADPSAVDPMESEVKPPAQISIVIEETYEEPVTPADLAPAIEEPPAEPLLTAKQPTEQPVKKGVVKLLFIAKPGNFHGYIAPDDGSKDILFHQKYINADIFEHLERGTPVTATVKCMEGKAYATRVSLLSPPSTD